MNDLRTRLTRREWLAAAAATPAAVAATGAVAASPAAPLLPARDDFEPTPFAYLDAGAVHPLSRGARAAAEAYLERKLRGRNDGSGGAPPESSARVFARLINADPEEIVHTQSTTMGENLALLALGLPGVGGRIVTDALHFFGSLYTYGEMKRAGMDVVTLPMTRDGAVSMDDMESAVNDRTKLVAVSLVSTINGFEHDLKKVCDIAHAHGAYVYADIIHGAGSVPIDVKASGVDFASSASYKWLMGDMGRAFLYVRKDLIDRVKRPWWGYHQVASFQSRGLPYDEPGEGPAGYTIRDDAAGLFAMGTSASIVEAQLGYSLPWLESAGIARIQAWRQPMIDAMQTELRRRGYEPLTPAGSKTPLVAFALKDARAALSERLRAANVRMTVAANRFRISVGVFNDMNDIDRALEALPKSP